MRLGRYRIMGTPFNFTVCVFYSWMERLMGDNEKESHEGWPSKACNNWYYVPGIPYRLFHLTHVNLLFRNQFA
jgi:hypothetical protein